MNPLLIAFSGSLGAAVRFVLDGHLRAKYGSSFPWATIIINVSGSFVLGAVSGYVLSHAGMGAMTSVIGVGFCGGYTTFSTASFETVRLIEQKKYKAALGNAAGSMIATIIAAAVGLSIGSWV